MNPLLVLLMAAACAAGPLADAWWAEQVAEVAASSSAYAADAGPGGLRVELTRAGSEGGVRISSAVTAGWMGASARLAGAFSGSRPRAGETDRALALSLRAQRVEAGAGRMRGGLGSGLLVSLTTPWGEPGAWAGPRAGRPTGLRVSPGPPQYSEAAGYYASDPHGRWTLARLRDGGGDASWLVSASPLPSTEVVAAIGKDSEGLEISVILEPPGSAVGVSAAGWRAEGEAGGAAEVRLASGEGNRFGIRAWRVWGSRAPLAPRARGATEQWRCGGELGVRLRPAPQWQILWELSRRFASDPALGGQRWDGRLDVRAGGTDGLQVRLRLSERHEERRLPWGGVDRSGAARGEVSVRLAAGGTGVLSGGLQHASERRGDGTTGVWMQLAGGLGSGHLWIRAARIFRADGSAVWWYEPAPAGTWGLRADRTITSRLVAAASGQRGRWYLRLVIEQGEPAMILVVCRTG